MSQPEDTNEVRVQLETAIADAVGSAYEAGRDGWSTTTAKAIADTPLRLLRSALAQQEEGGVGEAATVVMRERAKQYRQEATRYDLEAPDAEFEHDRDRMTLRATMLRDFAAVLEEEDRRLATPQPQQEEGGGAAADGWPPMTLVRPAGNRHATPWALAPGEIPDASYELRHYLPATPPPALSGPVIDATEFAEARRDPKVKALLDRAEQYGRELAEREQGEAGK